VSQRLIPTGERSGLLTHIAATFPSFVPLIERESCARTTQHAGQGIYAPIVTKADRSAPDAQLSAPALHLPTPRATG